jgi:hypothetical protein
MVGPVSAPAVRYFAYGSNMQTATLCGRRGITVIRARPARAAGWRLVFDKPPLVPVGEAYANLVAAPDAEVLGVLYEVSAADLAHIELTEGVPIGNYRPTEITVVAFAEPERALSAVTLVSDRRDPRLCPSDRYMRCLIAGAEEHGLPAEYVEFLRRVQSRPETVEATQLRGLIDAGFRQRKSPP